MAALSVVLILLAASCSKEQPSATAYRFDHVNRIAGRYAQLIAATDPSSSDMQRLLLDIHSRADVLRSIGDSLVADYFILAVDDSLRRLSPEVAAHVLGRE